jgi:hypothetical protein
MVGTSAAMRSPSVMIAPLPWSLTMVARAASSDFCFSLSLVKMIMVSLRAAAMPR